MKRVFMTIFLLVSFAFNIANAGTDECPGLSAEKLTTILSKKFNAEISNLEQDRLDFIGEMVSARERVNPEIEFTVSKQFEASCDLLILREKGTAKLHNCESGGVKSTPLEFNISDISNCGYFKRFKPVSQPTESETFGAFYNFVPLAALTGDELDYKTIPEQMTLAQSRAQQYCQYFGYRTGTYPDPDKSISYIEKDEKAYLISNGNLVLTEIGNKKLFGKKGLIFTEITCQK